MAEIGDALVDIQADIKKFAADIEKVRAILETLDDKTIVIKLKLDKKSLAAIESQLASLGRIEQALSTQVSLLNRIDSSYRDIGNQIATNVGTQDDYLRGEIEIDRAIQQHNDALRSQIQLRNEARREQLLTLQLARAERAEAARITRDLDQRNSRLVTFTGIIGQAVSRASQLSRVKFDNFNQLFASALAADSLLNALGNIFNSALKVRKVAVQMGAALALAFAAGAQAAGALITALSAAIGLAAALAGIGLIAITVKFLLDDAEVKAAQERAAAGFRETVLAASGELKGNLVEFFDTFDQGIRSQADAFSNFFSKVNGPLKRVGAEFNKFIASDDFDRILGKIGDSTARFLDKVADGLINFILGTEKVFGAIGKAAKEIRAAVGPGLFEGISADGIVAGIERLTRAIVSAGPGIRAFKENFGLAFDAVQVALEGVLKTVGEVGDELFNALGPIAATAALAAGQIASSFIRLSAEVFPAVQASAQEFISTFGANFAASIELLAEPLSAVGNAALQLGTSLAPLLPIFSQLLTNLDPIVVGFLAFLDTLAPLAVVIGEFVAQLAAGIGPVIGTIFNLFAVLGQVISTVLIPAFTLLNSTGLVPIIGGLVALGAIILVAVISWTALTARIGLASGAFTAVRLALTTAGGGLTAFRAGLTGTNIELAAISPRMLALGTATNLVAAQMTAAGAAIKASWVGTAATFVSSSTVVTASLSAIGTATGVVAAKVGAAAGAIKAFLTGTAVASLQAAASVARANATVAASNAAAAGSFSLAAAGSRVAAVSLRLYGATLTIVSVASRVAAVGTRLLAGAMALVGGPIGLVIIGITLLIAGFKGFMRILGGVIEILKGVGKALVFDFDGAKESFSKGMDDIVGGAKDAAGQISDTFTGSGEDSGAGFAEGAEEGIKKGFASLKINAGAAANDAAQSVATQFKDGFGQLDLSSQIAGIEALFKEGGFLAGSGFVEGVAERNVIAAMGESLQIDQATIDAFKASGDAMGSGLSTALQAKLADLKNVIPQSLGEAEALKALGTQIGGEGGKALVDSAEAAITRLKGGPQKAAKDAISVKEGEAAEQGTAAAKELITTVTEALESAAPQITAAISLAFDEALGILPGILGPKFTAMLNTAFATSIATNTKGLSPQIVASISLAFDAAFAILPGVLGPKLSSMLSVAFATSIATNTGLSPQIVASLSLAFDAAFAILPTVLGPKLSAMLGAVFAALDPAGAGLALSGTLTRIMQGAFGLAFISLPAVIAPLFRDALTAGTNQGLQGFGASLVGPINAAFAEGFSGVAAAIAGPVTDAFNSTLSLADGFSTDMGAKMAGAVTAMGEEMAGLDAAITPEVERAMTNAVAAVKKGGDDMVNALKNAKTQIDNIDFYGAGYSVGSRLAAGIRASTADLVVPAADAMAAAVAQRVPSSPAEKGPLSGSGDPLKTGAKIVERLVAGMRNEQPNLVNAITQLLAEFNSRQGNLGFNGGGATGGLQTGSSNDPFSGNLLGAFNPNIKGSIIRQDRSATVSSGSTSSVQIRPGTVNITVPGTDDPREFINNLSRELMTNCIAR